MCMCRCALTQFRDMYIELCMVSVSSLSAASPGRMQWHECRVHVYEGAGMAGNMFKRASSGSYVVGWYK